MITFIEYLKINYLHHLSTIRSWYSNTNGCPEFSMKSLKILKARSQVAKNKGKQLYGCLMIDEMAIRKQVQWDHSMKKFVGYIDYGTFLSLNQNNYHLPKKY